MPQTVTSTSALTGDGSGKSSNGRSRSIVYWITTAILATECIAGGAMGALHLQPFAGIIIHLGYPAYFMTIIGISYILAGIAVIVPRYPTLAEWAYAGLVFNYIGAFASHLSVNDPVPVVVTPLAFLLLTVVSYVLRPANRTRPTHE